MSAVTEPQLQEQRAVPAADRPPDDSARPQALLGRELLLEESTANERVISLWRLVFCLIAAMQLVVQAGFDGGGTGEPGWTLLGFAFIGVLYSTVLFVLHSRYGYSPILGFLSVGLDVSLITGALVGLIVAERPMFATNNTVAVPLYLLAIALAGLRYNPWLTVFATLLAIAEYVGVIWAAIGIGDLYNRLDPVVAQQISEYGQFDLKVQFANVVLVFSGGLVATFGVRRARELRTASIVDALTRLFNRGFLDERYRQEFNRAERYGRELSIVIVDVDHFKKYNDRNGHAAGDQVLREVADILRYGLRSTDVVARYGGEEFVAILPETAKPAALALTGRLLEQVAEHSFLYGDQQPNKAVTVSAGVACYPQDAKTPEELFHYADKMLYLAKDAGRNCVRG